MTHFGGYLRTGQSKQQRPELTAEGTEKQQQRRFNHEWTRIDTNDPLRLTADRPKPTEKAGINHGGH